MNQLRKLVYTKTENSLESEYTQFKNTLIVKNIQILFHIIMEKNWGRRQEWAVCFTDNASMINRFTLSPPPCY